MGYSSDLETSFKSKIKQVMVLSMGGKCQICGYSKENKALTFHHIDPTIKEIKLAEVRSSNLDWAKIVLELKKCILLCQNCHHEFHAGVTPLPKRFTKFIKKYEKFEYVIKLINNRCKTCGILLKTSRLYCSRKCTPVNRNVFVWDKKNSELFEEFQNSSIVEIAERYGISKDAAQKKRSKVLKENNHAKLSN